MRWSRYARALVGAGGLAVGVVALGYVLAAEEPARGQAASTLPRRAVIPMLAADSAEGVPASATPVTTATNPPSVTRTKTPEPATPIPLPTLYPVSIGY